MPIHPAQCHLDRHLFALAEDKNVNGLANRAFSNDAWQVAHGTDFLAIEAEDHVAGNDRSVIDRPSLDNAGDQSAARLIKAYAFRNLVGHRLDANTQPTPTRFPILTQLSDHAHRKLRGDREPDAD